jgi:hypothetical protein
MGTRGTASKGCMQGPHVSQPPHGVPQSSHGAVPHEAQPCARAVLAMPAQPMTMIAIAPEARFTRIVRFIVLSPRDYEASRKNVRKD